MWSLADPHPFKFSRPSDDFLKDLARRATSLSKEVAANPDNVKRITNLSLYQPVVYFDDSSSMSTGSRYYMITRPGPRSNRNQGSKYLIIYMNFVWGI